MSDNRRSQDDLLARIHGFIVAAERNELADSGWSDFEQLLRESDDACRLYAEYMDLCIFLPTILDIVPDQESLPSGAVPPNPPTLFPSPVGFLGHVVHGVLGCVPQGWPVAYLVATVILSIGLLIGTFVHVPQAVQVAAPSPTTHQKQLRPEPWPAFVGRITGMVDCVWADPHTAVPGPVAVPLGRKYALRSGLLEISYDTGAKVILQGPCTYEVDAAAGGYLSVGKLTARVEKRGEAAANPQSKIPNQQTPNRSLPTTHYPLFTVKTPTATVTDLGTEFGVEVDQRGATTSHVFRGSVRLQATFDDAEEETARVLHENESACVVGSNDGRKTAQIVMLHGEADAGQFVRQMPGELQGERRHPSMRVAAWYRLGEDDPGAIAGKAVDARTNNHRGYYPLAPRTKPTYSNNAAPVDSSLSMRFGGADDECLVNLHTPYLFTENFVLEAWARLRTTEDHPQFIAYNGDPNLNGYGLTVKDEHWQFLLGGIKMVDSGVRAELGRWTHLALVCEANSVRLWVNGQPVGEPFVTLPRMPDTSFSIGCDHTTNPPFSFHGEIDEVRLSQLQGPFKPEVLLFAPTPPEGEKGEEKGMK